MTAWLELLVLLAALAAVVVLGSDLGRSWFRGHRERRHLERLGESDAEEEASGERTLLPAVDRRLKAAGLAVGGLVWLATSALLAALVFFAVFEAFPGSLAAAGLAALLAAWLPWSLLGAWARRRARRFEEKLVDGVAFMISALQAGENPTRALASAADAAEGAVSVELRRLVDRLDVGMGIRQAMQPLVEGYDSEGTRLFTQSLAAKWAAGGNMAPVLERVNQIIRERLSMRLRLRAEMAGARLAAVLIALLPYLLIPVLFWRRPEWARALLAHPVGLQLLFMALMLQLVGVLWLRRIMRFEVQ